MRWCLLAAALAALLVAAQARPDGSLKALEAPAPAPATDGAPAAAPAPASGPTTYTLADVATHATADSLWAAINGKVYDLTQWAPVHPGGSSRILAIAGTDASAQFSAQHAGNPVVASQLEQFYIGDLAA